MYVQPVLCRKASFYVYHTDSTFIFTLRFDRNCTVVFAFNLLCSMFFLSICTLLLAFA